AGNFVTLVRPFEVQARGEKVVARLGQRSGGGVECRWWRTGDAVEGSSHRSGRLGERLRANPGRDPFAHEARDDLDVAGRERSFERRARIAVVTRFGAVGARRDAHSVAG